MAVVVVVGFVRTAVAEDCGDGCLFVNCLLEEVGSAFARGCIAEGGGGGGSCTCSAAAEGIGVRWLLFLDRTVEEVGPCCGGGGSARGGLTVEGGGGGDSGRGSIAEGATSSIPPHLWIQLA